MNKQIPLEIIDLNDKGKTYVVVCCDKCKTEITVDVANIIKKRHEIPADLLQVPANYQSSTFGSVEFARTS